MGKIAKYLFLVALIVISVTFIVLGVTQFGFWDKAKGPLGGFYPTLIASVLLVMSVWQLFLVGKQKDPVFKKEEWLIVLAIVAVFGCSYLLGMLVSLFVFLFLWLKLVEKRSLKMCLIFSTCVIVTVYLVFGLWLGIMFPTGLVGKLLG